MAANELVQRRETEQTRVRLLLRFRNIFFGQISTRFSCDTCRLDAHFWTEISQCFL